MIEEEKRIKEEEKINKKKRKAEAKENEKEDKENKRKKKEEEKLSRKRNTKEHEESSGNNQEKSLVKKAKPNDEIEIDESIPADKSVTKDLYRKYVMARFKTEQRVRHYVGKVLMVNDEEQKHKIDFLRKKSVCDNIVSFVKPHVPDVTEVDFKDKERVLCEPEYSRRGSLFTIFL